MTDFEALLLFIVFTFVTSVLGIVMDWVNFRLGQPWYQFPSKKMYYVTFIAVLTVFAVSYWLSFLALRLFIP